MRELIWNLIEKRIDMLILQAMRLLVENLDKWEMFLYE